MSLVEIHGEVTRSLRLARSPWPRTAGGPAQVRRAALAGLRQGRVVREIELAVSGEARAAGVAVAEDGTLRVSAAGRLFAIAGTRVLWSVAAPQSERAAGAFSAPLVTSDGASVVTCGDTAFFVDARGEIRGRLGVRAALDDSGPAPNVTSDGALVLTCITGEVIRWSAEGARSLGAFGYDVVAPAIDSEGALYVAGYAHRGAVCVDPAGDVRWRGGARDADMLPTVRGTGESAFAEVNANRTTLFAASGEVLGSYPAAGSAAELGRGDWALLARDRVARLDGRFAPRWEKRVEPPLPSLCWGGLGPVVDRDEQLVVPTADGVALLDGRNGARLASVTLGAAPVDVAIVAEERVAVLLADRLVVVA